MMEEPTRMNPAVLRALRERIEKDVRHIKKLQTELRQKLAELQNAHPLKPAYSAMFAERIREVIQEVRKYTKEMAENALLRTRRALAEAPKWDINYLKRTALFFPLPSGTIANEEGLLPNERMLLKIFKVQMTFLQAMAEDTRRQRYLQEFQAMSVEELLEIIQESGPQGDLARLYTVEVSLKQRSLSQTEYATLQTAIKKAENLVLKQIPGRSEALLELQKIETFAGLLRHAHQWATGDTNEDIDVTIETFQFPQEEKGAEQQS